jgi:hypothetical protein
MPLITVTIVKPKPGDLKSTVLSVLHSGSDA